MAPVARLQTVPLPPPPSLPHSHQLPIRSATMGSSSTTPVSSRNDLFSTSWLPEIPAPPPNPSPVSLGNSTGNLPPAFAARIKEHSERHASVTSNSLAAQQQPPTPPAAQSLDSLGQITAPSSTPASTVPVNVPRLQAVTVASQPSSSSSSTSPRLHPAVLVPVQPTFRTPRSHALTLPQLALQTDSPPTPPPPFLGDHARIASSPPASPTPLTGVSHCSSAYSPGLLTTPIQYSHASHPSSLSPKTAFTFESPVSPPLAFGNMTATSDRGSSPAAPFGASPTGTSPSASKTSSFFETAAADTPPPAPRLSSNLAPSPLSLSRASSLRARALPARTSPPSPPPPMSPDEDGDMCESPHSFAKHLSPRPDLSLLHQSPLHPSPTPAAGRAAAACSLPRPPDAGHIALRLYPDDTYILGEGRHACVYLAAYKRVGAERAERSLFSARSGKSRLRGITRPTVTGDTDGEWTLCAAKRLAGDRESQTLGLREAFFLNRLGAPSRRSRGLSPSGRDIFRGRVYVVKLIAVKDEAAPAATRSAHARSVSDSADGSTLSTPGTVPGTPGSEMSSPIGRPRSSTIFAGSRQQSPSPSPSEGARLILVLEHAPLGSLDRFLRTSPGLVGQQLWGRWAREAAEALEWVHSRGIVHADVKPSNLLLTADLHLRLSDFGSSLLVHPAHPPTDGIGLGTLPFSPPELVDPSAPFSFPVDIFALGATLYQCITGREPYRGSRPVEMMHHVRNGGLWAWEERERLDRVGAGTDTPATAASSPYPSAARRDESPYEPAIRRAGSLRVPTSTARGSILPPGAATPDKSWGRLHRVGSVESVQAADDVVSTNTDSTPAGVKLWHQWSKSARGETYPYARDAERDPVARLVRPDIPSPPASPSVPGPATASAAALATSPTAVSRSSSLRHAHTAGAPSTGAATATAVASASMSRTSSLRSPIESTHSHGCSPTSPTATAMWTRAASGGAGPSAAPPCPPQSPTPSIATAGAMYADGAPAMHFLGDGARVPDDIRDVLHTMLEAAPEVRPTATELVSAWETLGVGVDEEYGVEELEVERA